MADGSQIANAGSGAAESAPKNVSSQNILGDNPKLVRAEKTTPAAAPKKEAQARPDDNLRAETRDTTGADVSSFDALIDEAEKAIADSGDAAGDDAAAGGDEDEETGDASLRAQKRIRALVQQKKAAEEQVRQIRDWGKQLASEHKQVLQYSQNLDRQNRQMREQMASFDARVKTMMELQGRGPQEKRSEVDEFQAKTVEQALAKARETFDPRVDELTKQNRQLFDEIARERLNVKKQELRQRLDKQAFQATDSEFFQGQYPDETKQKLRYTFSRLVLAYSHGRQIPVPEAASELAPLIRDHAFALLRAHAAGRGQKVAQSQNTPLPGPRGMSPGKGNNVISNEDAKKSGFKNSLDAALSKGGIIRARH